MSITACAHCAALTQSSSMFSASETLLSSDWLFSFILSSLASAADTAGACSTIYKTLPSISVDIYIVIVIVIIIVIDLGVNGHGMG